MQGYLEAERSKVVVCDNGTGVRPRWGRCSALPARRWASEQRSRHPCRLIAQLVKCGFAGDNFPRSVFPCMVGRPVLRFEDQLSDAKPIKVGPRRPAAAASHAAPLPLLARPGPGRRLPGWRASQPARCCRRRGAHGTHPRLRRPPRRTCRWAPSAASTAPTLS
jgi:hypothetical protein